MGTLGATKNTGTGGWTSDAPNITGPVGTGGLSLSPARAAIF